MSAEKTLIHISSNDLLDIQKQEDWQERYQVVVTVPMEMRLLQFAIDSAIVFFIAMLLNLVIDMESFHLTYIILFLAYNLGMELTVKRSVGKILLKHVVISKELKIINEENAIVRTVCRLIPLDQIFCMGNYSYGLHDRFSGTYVVTEKEFERLKNSI